MNAPVFRRTRNGLGAAHRYAPLAARRTCHVTSADGTRIHLEEHGPQGAPTVVLSHGWTCSTLFWAPVIRALSGTVRVVAYDQRGHGRSDAPGRGGYSIEALADDFAAVVDSAVPAGERAVLVGHSMGGMTLMAAADQPQVMRRTAAVLLASTGSGRLLQDAQVAPAWVRRPALRAAFQRLLLTSPAPLGPITPVSRAALRYGVLSPSATREMVQATARLVHACPPRSRSAWGHVLARLDLDEQLAAIAAPTAVLVGTADRLTPPVHAHGMARRLQRFAGLTELPGVGHMTPLEAPDTVAELIRGLVRDHLHRRPAGARLVEKEETA